MNWAAARVLPHVSAARFVGQLLVSAPKTDAGSRQVPIPAFVADELAARRTDEDRDESAGLLFAAPGGAPTSATPTSAGARGRRQ